MPPELRKKFKNSKNIDFDVHEEFKFTIKNNIKAKTIIEKSIEQHAQMCIENTVELFDAKKLAKELYDEIDFRVRQYCVCLGNTTKNYRSWLIEDYVIKLNLSIGKLYRLKVLSE